MPSMVRRIFPSVVLCGGMVLAACTRVDPPPAEHPLIRVHVPAIHDVVGDVVDVQGEARGQWFFEATFPIEVTDSAGNSLGVSYAQAQGEWMTEEFVSFKGQVRREKTLDNVGWLIFRKDNPSGLPEYEDAIRIPVRFR